jgi:hypothetical protein
MSPAFKPFIDQVLIPCQRAFFRPIIIPMIKPISIVKGSRIMLEISNFQNKNLKETA